MGDVGSGAFVRTQSFIVVVMIAIGKADLGE